MSGSDAAKRYAVLQHAANYSLDHLTRLSERPVAARNDDQNTRRTHQMLGGPLPDGGEDAETVIATLARCAPDGVVASGGPRFFGYVVGGAQPVAIAADWLVSSWDQFAAVFDGGPAVAVAEQTALEWVIDLLGLRPQGGGGQRAVSGGFTTGTTVAHLTAVAAARHALLAARGWDAEAHGLWNAPRFEVFTGRDVHVSVLAALQYAGIGREHVRRVDTDEHGRMRPEALAGALETVDGPALVCVQAGEINTGAFDPIADIAAITRPRGDWLHVDGAFGLWAAAAPELAHLTEGIEHADSWATDAHKMLNVPYDCGIVLCAHPGAHRAAMTTHAPYTTMGPATLADHQRNGMEFVPEMARRARGVPVWAAIRALGRSGIAELVTRCHTLACQMASALDQDPQVRIAGPVFFNQVLVDCAPPELDEAATERFVRRVIAAIREDGTCWAGGTRWRGRPMLRLSVANWSTTADDIERSAKAILHATDAAREVHA